MIQSIENISKASKKVLASGMLVAALVVASLSATPAHATATFTVNSASDFGDRNLDDGICSDGFGACTLRAAIEQANKTTGADVINFNIPVIGVATLRPNSQLPLITESVIIDGYTQPGSSPNTLVKGTNAVLKVELDGTNAGSFTDGLKTSRVASATTIRGLVINRFKGDGLQIGTAKVEGNFIGTDTTGTIDLGNGGDGVQLTAGAVNNTIGGTSPAARNLISGNDLEGVELSGRARDNKVEGNLIGTSKDGVSPLANSDDGVKIFQGATGNTVGGTTAASANTIAFNGDEGVAVSDSDTLSNSILHNSIFSNVGLGIDLVGGTENTAGVTANDAGDGDSGPNGLQNSPVITSARNASGKTTIKGRLNSSAGAQFTVELFSNPSGNEGKKFLGSKSVTTGSDGNVTFAFTPTKAVALGQRITATATDSKDNTSEFSVPKKVVVS